MKSISIRISGQVQGVGFRYNALGAANEMKIRGFVRNCTDGSVYIEAEGDDLAIERFVEWCRNGPRWALVEQCEVKPIAPSGYPDFSIHQ